MGALIIQRTAEVPIHGKSVEALATICSLAVERIENRDTSIGPMLTDEQRGDVYRLIGEIQSAL